MKITRIAIACLSLSILAPAADAQTYPPPGHPDWLYAGIDQTTLQYYYGCATGVSNACIYAALGTFPGQSTWIMMYPWFVDDADGNQWTVYDIWGGYNPSTSCGAGGDILQFQENSCVVQERADLTWTTRLDRWGAGMEYIVAPIDLHAIAAPEPSTMLLVGSGLAGLLAAKRKRSRSHQKSDAES